MLMTHCGTVNVMDRIAIPPSKSKLLSLYFVRSPHIHDPGCRFCVLLLRLFMLMGKETCKTEARILSAIYGPIGPLCDGWSELNHSLTSLIHKEILLRAHTLKFVSKEIFCIRVSKGRNKIACFCWVTIAPAGSFLYTLLYILTHISFMLAVVR
jgi:hypothetical protein